MLRFKRRSRQRHSPPVALFLYRELDNVFSAAVYQTAEGKIDFIHRIVSSQILDMQIGYDKMTR